MKNPFEITKDEVLELAAQKLANSVAEQSDISETANRLISERVKELFEKGLKARIDEFLDAEMRKVIGEEIVPVNIWGEREGKPTTIRAELAKRAKEFWGTKVDEQGRESSWGGIERSTRLMQQILKDEFAAAIKSNAEVIVAEFKKALQTESTRIVTDNIDRLIKTKGN